ncbi:MAG: sulfotransferase domain-containing protein [Fibrobacteria bacterium]|nr:sulfotransferase domain-containing protein [Fibrobacteria bacterium]
MPFPNFLIIGTQEAETRYLSRLIGQHPEIFTLSQETHFFDKSANFEKGLAWYKSHFSKVTSETAIGECTADYCCVNGRGDEGRLPNVHQNIYEAFPDMKLIFVLRNPVARAISAVNRITNEGKLSPLLDINELLIGPKNNLLKRYGVIENGYYYQQIDAFLRFFKRNQILFLIFEEEIEINISNGLEKIFEFMGVDKHFKIGPLSHESGPLQRTKAGMILSYYFPQAKKLALKADKLFKKPAKEKWPNRYTLATLFKMYQPENEKLFAFLDRTVPAWFTLDL